MRVLYLQISNILSFKYVSDISQAEKINFDDGLNIIIGENGSGKSTALEAINFLFRRVLFRKCLVRHDILAEPRIRPANDLRQALQLDNQNDVSGLRLDPNWNTPKEKQSIRIAVQLDQIDNNNIANIRTHFAALQEVLASFSHTSLNDDDEITDGAHNVYLIDVTIKPSTRSFSVKSLPSDFGFTYLSHYNLIKEAIRLYNMEYLHAPLPALFESFTLITSFRNYHSFSSSVSLSGGASSSQIQGIRNQEYNLSLNTNESTEPAIFALVRLRVAGRHFELMNEAITPEKRERKANELPFLVSINEHLRTVNLSCRIQLLDLSSWQYSFQFFDIRRNRSIEDVGLLSAGQRALVHLIFEAYGRGDLKGGVVIIDEPEIHLHYQFQHEYLQALRRLNESQNCQYILVTHSESLIDANTITSVRRFALDAEGHTAVFAPDLSSDQKSLIRILDNSRSTYAFFAKKVILVEGDTDRFFFRAVIQQLYPALDQEIAVLHIGGKGEFPKWRSLFESFGLRVFTIADLDYLCNLHYRNEQSRSLRAIEKVSEFKQCHPEWETHIEAEAEKRIFILKEGNLEIYLGTRKDLTDVIKFCRSKLSDFLQDDSSSKSQEIRSIFERIIH
jgi:predicted ATP-dependent endonuclease of OLD family